MKFRFLYLLAVPAIALSVGCLSFQSYGSHTRGHSISEGASRADVLMNLGEPDTIYRAADTETFIYRGLKGTNILGLYSTVNRQDMVVVMDAGGRVLTAVPVERGKGSSVISPLVLNGTHPVPTGELFDGNNNYEYLFENSSN